MDMHNNQFIGLIIVSPITAHGDGDDGCLDVQEHIFITACKNKIGFFSGKLLLCANSTISHLNVNSSSKQCSSRWSFAPSQISFLGYYDQKTLAKAMGRSELLYVQSFFLLIVCTKILFLLDWISLAAIKLDMTSCRKSRTTLILALVS